MANNTTTGAPYLESTDAPDLAGITKQIADWTAEGKVLLTAVDSAERDSLYSAVPAPALCASADATTLWMKVTNTGASGDWKTIWSDTGWKTGGFSVSGLQFTLGEGQYRRRGDEVTIEGVVTATADIGPTTASGIHSGNLAGDPGIIYLPAGTYPDKGVPIPLESSFGLWGGRVLPSGVIAIYDGPVGATLSAGDNVSFYATYLSSL